MQDFLSVQTQHPRTSAGITFRRIVRMMHRIRANNDSISWLRELDSWHKECGK